MPIKKRSIQRVQVDLGKKIADIKGPQSDKAVFLILASGSAAATSMTPVDTGFLVNSLTAPQVANGAGRVGFVAKYAAAVHNKSGKLKGQQRSNNRGKYWDPSGEPKFLEKGFEEIKPSIPAILKKAYQ